MTIGYQRAPGPHADTRNGAAPAESGDHSAREHSTRVHTVQNQPPQEQSVKDLVKSLSEETTRLVRDEIKLATLELKEKGKHAGIGIGMFGAAGVVALFGAGALLASFIMLLALAIDAWASALIFAVLLFAVGGFLALKGKKQVTQAVPPAPEESVQSIKADIAVLKESAHK